MWFGGQGKCKTNYGCFCPFSSFFRTWSGSIKQQIEGYEFEIPGFEVVKTIIFSSHSLSQISLVDICLKDYKNIFVIKVSNVLHCYSVAETWILNDILLSDLLQTTIYYFEIQKISKTVHFSHNYFRNDFVASWRAQKLVRKFVEAKISDDSVD